MSILENSADLLAPFYVAGTNAGNMGWGPLGAEFKRYIMGRDLSPQIAAMSAALGVVP